jgi:hypothetical protein
MTMAQAKQKPNDDVGQAADEPIMVVVGDRIWVLTHPDRNEGREVAPATVTHVHDDGTVAAGVHTASGYTTVDRVPVHATREAALKALEAHVPDLRPRKIEDEYGTTHEVKPTAVDVLHWVPAAYVG